MRLLNVHTLELENFPGDPPPYATLSHQWGKAEDEVSFQAILQLPTQPSVRNKTGFAKILGCSEQAKKHGLDYIWIDTCCIDKANSTELQEAINSMWHWYRACARCFVYMKDVRSGQRPHADGSDFSQSQWFRRGWTLQELLAPGKITFFAEDWERIGKMANRNIMTRITLITGIPEGVLSDGEPHSFSVARRMFWAARRETTKQEDMAYSLMGIFGITMPIIYGGGENMFVKFQREIMKRSVDQSIFAWTVESASSTETTGLLTSSPAYFAEVDEIQCNVFVDKFSDMIKPNPTPQTHYSHTNLGIQITLPMKRVKGNDSLRLAMLRCALPDNPDRPLCIYLQPLAGGSNQWVRTRISELIPVPRDGELFENTQIFAKEDTSFFDPRQRKRHVSVDTFVPSIRGSVVRSSSVCPPLERQAVHEASERELRPPTNVIHGPPARPASPRSNPPRLRDGYGEPISAIPVTGNSRLQTKPLPPPPSNTPPPTTPPLNTPPLNTPPLNTPPLNTPPLNTPPLNTPPPYPTIQHDSRANTSLSRDASNDRPSPILTALPVSVPERHCELPPELRAPTPQSFEGPVSKIWYNKSYAKTHPQRPQFLERGHKVSRSLSPQHFPDGEPICFKQHAAPTSRPRGNSLTIPGAPSPAGPLTSPSSECSIPVGSCRAQRGHSKSPSRLSYTHSTDPGGSVSRIRGRNLSRKPLGSPESSPSRSTRAQPPTITINVTPADGEPCSSVPLPVSPVPTTPLSAASSEYTASLSSAPHTPPQISVPLSTRSMPISKANNIFHGEKESDPFNSSLNPAVRFTSRPGTQLLPHPSPAPDKPHAIPTNGGGFVWIPVSPVQSEAPSPSASSQHTKSSGGGASLLRRLKGILHRNL
ncbi:HET-domain-containing protein [Gyrodon lividus]|nr:HET-domain-containing protein [Gyrodon lividus]